MAKSILTRTMFMDNRNDQVRFFDWCVVGTTLGTMIEPLNYNKFTVGQRNFDHLDECTKINKIECMDRRNKFAFLGSGTVLHGGDQIPKNEEY